MPHSQGVSRKYRNASRPDRSPKSILVPHSDGKRRGEISEREEKGLLSGQRRAGHATNNSETEKLCLVHGFSHAVRGKKADSIRATVLAELVEEMKEASEHATPEQKAQYLEGVSVYPEIMEEMAKVDKLLVDQEEKIKKFEKYMPEYVLYKKEIEKSKQSAWQNNKRSTQLVAYKISNIWDFIKMKEEALEKEEKLKREKEEHAQMMKEREAMLAEERRQREAEKEAWGKKDAMSDRERRKRGEELYQRAMQEREEKRKREEAERRKKQQEADEREKMLKRKREEEQLEIQRQDALRAKREEEAQARYMKERTRKAAEEKQQAELAAIQAREALEKEAMMAAQTAELKHHEETMEDIRTKEEMAKTLEQSLRRSNLPTATRQNVSLMGYMHETAVSDLHERAKIFEKKAAGSLGKLAPQSQVDSTIVDCNKEKDVCERETEDMLSQARDHWQTSITLVLQLKQILTQMPECTTPMELIKEGLALSKSMEEEHHLMQYLERAAKDNYDSKMTKFLDYIKTFSTESSRMKLNACYDNLRDMLRSWSNVIGMILPAMKEAQEFQNLFTANLSTREFNKDDFMAALHRRLESYSRLSKSMEKEKKDFESRRAAMQSTSHDIMSKKSMQDYIMSKSKELNLQTPQTIVEMSELMNKLSMLQRMIDKKSTEVNRFRMLLHETNDIMQNPQMTQVQRDSCRKLRDDEKTCINELTSLVEQFDIVSNQIKTRQTSAVTHSTFNPQVEERRDREQGPHILQSNFKGQPVILENSRPLGQPMSRQRSWEPTSQEEEAGYSRLDHKQRSRKFRGNTDRPPRADARGLPPRLVPVVPPTRPATPLRDIPRDLPPRDIPRTSEPRSTQRDPSPRPLPPLPSAEGPRAGGEPRYIDQPIRSKVQRGPTPPTPPKPGGASQQAGPPPQARPNPTWVQRPPDTLGEDGWMTVTAKSSRDAFVEKYRAEADQKKTSDVNQHQKTETSQSETSRKTHSHGDERTQIP